MIAKCWNDYLAFLFGMCIRFFDFLDCYSLMVSPDNKRCIGGALYRSAIVYGSGNLKDCGAFSHQFIAWLILYLFTAVKVFSLFVFLTVSMPNLRSKIWVPVITESSQKLFRKDRKYWKEFILLHYLILQNICQFYISQESSRNMIGPADCIHDENRLCNRSGY